MEEGGSSALSHFERNWRKGKAQKTNLLALLLNTNTGITIINIAHGMLVTFSMRTLF